MAVDPEVDRAGGALGRAHHADARDVLGLVLHAYEDACEMLAFARDHDGDELREQEILRVIDAIAGFGFTEEYRYELAIVGGVPRPKLEGWMLCLLGVAGTDDMTRVRVDRELAAAAVELKSTEQYVAITEACVLPTGDGSLPTWLARADATFRRLIDGT